MRVAHGLGWAFVLGTGLWFCGGQSEKTPGASPDASASSSSSSGGSSSGGGVYVSGTHSPGCPDAPPAVESACVTNDLTCEYGDDFNPECNLLLHCSSGRWGKAYSPGGPSGDTCPSGGPPNDPPPTSSPDCPATQPSGPCSGKLSCHYGSDLSTECDCGPVCSSYPVAYCQDAGIDWRCGPTPKNTTICSVPRPRIGTPCSTDGETCRVGKAHGEACEESSIACRGGQWSTNNYGCPVSSARYKEQIAYVDDDGRDALAKQLMEIRLASYKYRPGVADDGRHLGFIIDDQPPGSPAVLSSRERVDLYGYVSMAVAAIQKQDREIAALRRKVEELEKRPAPPR
jgi:hypothetical protein